MIETLICPEINTLTLAPLVAIALMFIAIVTNMWKRSISTFVHAITVSLAIVVYEPAGAVAAIGLTVVGLLFNMSRAVVNTERDRILKRSKAVFRKRCDTCPNAST